MTREEADIQDLGVINASMAALKEIQNLPEQDEFSLLRAQAHTHAIMARAECEALLNRVAA